MLSIIMSLILSLSGITVTVQAPSGCHPCYVQVDPSSGLAVTPQIFQFDLAPGESFGHAVAVTVLPGPHPQGERVRVRVWTETSGTDATTDQTIVLVPDTARHVYVPLLFH